MGCVVGTGTEEVEVDLLTGAEDVTVLTSVLNPYAAGVLVGCVAVELLFADDGVVCTTYGIGVYAGTVEAGLAVDDVWIDEDGWVDEEVWTVGELCADDVV